MIALVVPLVIVFLAAFVIAWVVSRQWGSLWALAAFWGAFGGGLLAKGGLPRMVKVWEDQPMRLSFHPWELGFGLLFLAFATYFWWRAVRRDHRQFARRPRRKNLLAA